MFYEKNMLMRFQDYLILFVFQILKSHYKKVTEFAKITGPLYEVKTIALLYLRALKQHENFQIASNMKAAHSFDDIVFVTDNRTIFIQLKHKEKAQKKIIDIHQLLQLKGDYSLLKYYKSYCEIEKQWKSDIHLKLCGKFENSVFVLYTNCRIDEKLGIKNKFDFVEIINSGGTSSCFEKKHDKDIYHLFERLPEYEQILTQAINSDQIQESADILNIVKKLLNSNAKYLPSEADLTMLLTEIKSLGSLSNWKEFLAKFYLLSEQASEKQLDNRIRQEMKNICSSDIMFSNFLWEVQHWWNNDNYFLTNKTQFWQNILEIHIGIISGKKSNLTVLKKIQYNENELNTIRKKFAPSERIINIVSECRNFTCLKVMQSLERCVYINIEILKSHCNKLLTLWKLGSECEILLVEGWENMFEIVEGCFDVLRTKLDKTLMVVTSSSDEKPMQLFNLFQHRIIDDSFSFNQLNKTSKQSILETNINFQGNSLSLKSLADKTAFGRLLTCDILTELLTENNTLEVGKKETEENKFYFTRVMKRREYVNEKIFQKQWNKYFAVSETSLEELEELIPQETIEKYDKNKDIDLNSCHIYVIDEDADFRQICKLCNDDESVFTDKSFNEGNSVHWLQKCTDGFMWKNSYGDIKLIKTHLMQDTVYVEYKTLSDITKHPDKLVLIVGDPGMGKSTALSHFATEFKKKDLTKWVVRVNLNEFTDYLSQNKPDATYILIQAGKFTTKFQQHLFEYELQTGGNVVVLLDGFDEISPLYSEKVINIIERLLQMEIRSIWITSRPVMKDMLEDSLHTLSYMLQPILLENQTKFLLQLWKVPYASTYKCFDFTNKLFNLITRSLRNFCGDFTGSPLHLKLLGEILQDEVLHYLETGEFVTNLPYALDVLNLYYKFVEKKLEIFKKKYKLDTTKTGVCENYQDLKNKVQESHMICALVSVLGIKEIKKLYNSEIF